MDIVLTTDQREPTQARQIVVMTPQILMLIVVTVARQRIIDSRHGDVM